MRLLDGLWKFIYWPVVWVVIFTPSIIRGDIASISGFPGLLVRACGIIILIWAFAIHIIAGKTLKRLGHSREHAGIWPDRLVTSGIYLCMRHPQQLAFVLIPIGVALILTSPTAMISSGWGVLAAFLFVLMIEEPECLRKYGTTYYEYMGKTLAFSLKPGCIVAGLKGIKQ